MNVIEPKKTLKTLSRHPILQEGRYGKLRLDKNENTIGFSQEIVTDILSGITPDFLAAYPEPYVLYRKLAEHHHVEVDSLVLTAGSELAIRYLLEAFLTPGDEIVILNPSFAMFEVYSAMIGATVRTVDFDETLCVSAESVIAAVTGKTKIIAIANPNNPTGTVFSQADIERILNAAAEVQAIVLVDEAYYYFCKDTMLPVCSEFPNLVVTRTFSKACGIAGVRLGYAVGSAALISQVKKLQPIDHVSNFAIKVGEYVLDHEDLVWSYVAEVQAGKKFLLSQLSHDGIRCVDSSANFVLADFGNRQEELVRKLREHNILVGAHLRLPFSSGYVRVTVGPVNQMQQFIGTLRGLLSGLDVPAYLYGTVLTK